MTLVILTGASGSGKTTIARAVAATTSYEVRMFDSIGIPPDAEIRAYGEGHQPGGAWQRAMTLRWLAELAPLPRPVLFEGQMRIAFIAEAIAAAGIADARIVLVDCDDATRSARLCGDRGQPELATADMMAWGRYLRAEATAAGCSILDTSLSSIAACRDRIISLLTA